MSKTKARTHAELAAFINNLNYALKEGAWAWRPGVQGDIPITRVLIEDNRRLAAAAAARLLASQQLAAITTPPAPSPPFPPLMPIPAPDDE